MGLSVNNKQKVRQAMVKISDLARALILLFNSQNVSNSERACFPPLNNLNSLPIKHPYIKSTMFKN